MADAKLMSFLIKVGQATNKSTGEKFPIFKTIDKNGKTVKVIFRKAVQQVPQFDCTIHVRADKCNVVQRGAYRDLWVHEIESTEAVFQPNLFEEAENRKSIPLEDLF